jgi:hypothetical protein
LSGGLAQELYCGTAAGSSAHSNDTPGSLLAKVNCDASAALISAGGAEAMLVSGGVTSSTLHSQTAPSVSTSKFGLSAVTLKVCMPAGCPVESARSASPYVFGDSHH